nr:endonuclease [Bacteroidales bacterium]
NIGAAYFLKLAEYNGGFDKLWELHLEPLLREYLRGLPDVKDKLDKMKNAYKTETPIDEKSI